MEKMKVLGSKIDTEYDIKHRKSLAIDALIKLEKVFSSKHISLKTKKRLFEE